MQYSYSLWLLVLVIGSSDFQQFFPIQLTNQGVISISALDDFTTLEYEDRVQLTFTPSNPALVPGLENVGEYIRDTSIVNINDTDSKNYTPYISCTLIYNPFSELQINFDVEGCDYSKIEEGSTSLEPPIRLQFITNQNPFTVTLTPSSVDTVEALGLGVFINTFTIPPGSRATAGLWTTFFIFKRAFTTFNGTKNVSMYKYKQ